jgi:hypothetical protein
VKQYIFFAKNERKITENQRTAKKIVNYQVLNVLGVFQWVLTYYLTVQSTDEKILIFRFDTNLRCMNQRPGIAPFQIVYSPHIPELKSDGILKSRYGCFEH